MRLAQRSKFALTRTRDIARRVSAANRNTLQGKAQFPHGALSLSLSASCWPHRIPHAVSGNGRVHYHQVDSCMIRPRQKGESVGRSNVEWSKLQLGASDIAADAEHTHSSFTRLVEPVG